MNNSQPKRFESPVEARVEDLAHDGCGVLKVGERVYFVDGVLPGETVRFLPGKKRKGKYQGVVESVLQASSQRVNPECEYFGVCGGCVLQHFDPQSQLKYKEKILFQNLKRIGRVRAENTIAPIQESIWHYRRKARLGVKFVPKKGGVLVGFRERNSSFITSLEKCQTLDQRISDLLPGLNQLISGLSNNNRIPQIEVAAGDHQLALVLRHLEPLNQNDISRLGDYAKAFKVSMYLQSGGPKTVVALCPESPQALTYELPEFDLCLEFGPTDFTQINAEVNRKMVRQAVGYLNPQPGDRVLDLFCGIGNFTLAIGKSGAHVVGVEGDEDLVRRGKNNANRNNLESVEFQKCNLQNESLDHLPGGRRFDKMLIDPPRSGALEVVSQLVPDIEPELLVYISCNPATLSRDSDVMVNTNGYRLTHAGVIDMFPHTAHVESMAVFQRT